MLRVLLFEDNAALRESLADLLASTPDLQLIGAYPTAEAAERQQIGESDVKISVHRGLKLLAARVKDSLL